MQANNIHLVTKSVHYDCQGQPIISATKANSCHEIIDRRPALNGLFHAYTELKESPTRARMRNCASAVALFLHYCRSSNTCVILDIPRCVALRSVGGETDNAPP